MLSHRTQAADVCRTTVNRDGVPASRVASSADSAENAPMSGRRESATVRLALWCKRRARAQQECNAMVEAAQPCHASPHQVLFRGRVTISRRQFDISAYAREAVARVYGCIDAESVRHVGRLEEDRPRKRARGLRHPATAGIRRPSYETPTIMSGSIVTIGIRLSLDAYDPHWEDDSRNRGDLSREVGRGARGDISISP